MKLIRFAALVLVVLLCTATLLPAQAAYCSYFNKHGNHNWKDAFVQTSPTCTKNGVMYIECVECGEPGIRVMDKLAHIYGDWRVKRKPTDCELGLRGRTCQVCGYEQIEEVWPAGTVRKGTQDANAIRSLQELLVQGGYLTAVTGVYDEETENAVRAVQREAGFNVNGTAWPQTIAYLQSKLGAFASTEPQPTPAVTPVPQATQAPAAPDTGYVIPVDAQQAHCTYVEVDAGVMAVVYCPTHQMLLDNCEMMLSFAQTEALKAEALHMYRMMWESELALQYQNWAAQAATEEDKGMVMSHQAMFTSYLSMQESTWKRMYGADTIRVQEQVIAALMQQCAHVCMMSAPLE